MRSSCLAALLLALPLIFHPAVAQEKAVPSAAYKIGERLPAASSPAARSATGFREIEWQSLTPKNWDTSGLFKDIDFASLTDEDPRAAVALQKLRNAWDKAPVEPAMNGARVRIPGFIVPLESQRGEVTEFLLVPYFGACVHTPPPPANQTIHVFPTEPVKNVQMMDAVWVSGTLETTLSQTLFGNAGYRLKAELITPYKK